VSKDVALNKSAVFSDRSALFGTAAVAEKMFIILLVTEFIKLFRYERWSG
jgi:hypothetical protein